MSKDFKHIGVLGMHWGRRKGSKIPIKKSKPRIKISEDYAIKEKLKTKKLSEMSNKELRSFNERLQLERQYKDLTKSDISPGRKFVSTFLTSPVKEVGMGIAKEIIRDIVKKKIQQSISSS